MSSNFDTVFPLPANQRPSAPLPQPLQNWPYHPTQVAAMRTPPPPLLFRGLDVLEIQSSLHGLVPLQNRLTAKGPTYHLSGTRGDRRWISTTPCVDCAIQWANHGKDDAAGSFTVVVIDTALLLAKYSGYITWCYNATVRPVTMSNDPNYGTLSIQAYGNARSMQDYMFHGYIHPGAIVFRFNTAGPDSRWISSCIQPRPRLGDRWHDWGRLPQPPTSAARYVQRAIYAEQVYVTLQTHGDCCLHAMDLLMKHLHALLVSYTRYVSQLEDIYYADAIPMQDLKL